MLTCIICGDSAKDVIDYLRARLLTYERQLETYRAIVRAERHIVDIYRERTDSP